MSDKNYIEMDMQEAINTQLKWCKSPMYTCGVFASSRSYLDILFNLTVNSIVDVNEIRNISSSVHSKRILFEDGSAIFFGIVKNNVNTGVVEGAIIDSSINAETVTNTILPHIKGDYEHIIVVNPSSASTGDNNEEEYT